MSFVAQSSSRQQDHETVMWDMRQSLQVLEMAILNLEKNDPFLEPAESGRGSVQEGHIHIRIQQRNGRKTLTTVQGIAEEYDKKRIVKVCKKEFACNGTVVDHPEYGEVLQLQGDQRNHVYDFLIKSGLAKKEQIKMHGF